MFACFIQQAGISSSALAGPKLRIHRIITKNIIATTFSMAGQAVGLGGRTMEEMDLKGSLIVISVPTTMEMYCKCCSSTDERLFQ